MSQPKTSFPFLYREREVTELKYYIENRWPSVVVHGMKGTGKTSVTKFVLDTLVQSKGRSSKSTIDGGRNGGHGQLNYSWINCWEKMTPVQMYRNILLDIQSSPGDIVDIDGDCNWSNLKRSKCTKPTVFVQKLREHFSNQIVTGSDHFSNPNGESGHSSNSNGESGHSSNSNGESGHFSDRRPQLILVLDHAEILMQQNDQDSRLFINLIHSLHEVLSDTVAISVIMISRMLPTSLMSISTVVHSPIRIFFKSYNFNQIMGILKMLKPDAITQSDSFYENYLNLSVRMVFNLTRNLNEIKFIVDANYSKYIDPMKKGGATENDSIKLWRSFEQTLRRSLINIGMKGHRTLNEVPVWNNQISKSSIAYQPDANLKGAKFGDAYFGDATFGSDASQGSASSMSSLATSAPSNIPSNYDDIPYTMKYLLIAAYLASNNSKATDKRFFLKGQFKHCGRKSHALNNREEEEDGKYIGAKYFPMERLIHIYRSLLDLNYDFGRQSGDAKTLGPKISNAKNLGAKNPEINGNASDDDEYDEVIKRYKVAPGEEITSSQQEMMDDENDEGLSTNYQKKTSILASSRMKETSNDFLSQLETLIRLKLIDRMNVTSNQLSSTRKFKVSDLISFEYVDAISKTLDFDLKQHLEQYMFRK